MPSWNQVLKNLNGSNRKDALDFYRRLYLKKLHRLRGRNVIAYYSGFLQKPGLSNSSIVDEDKNGFMAAIHKLDRTKGLDLLLHSPGGDMAATESIIDYLHRMFDGDVTAFVPQIAMSGGTMIACSCKEIYMGKQSNIGPIDPQFGGIPAHGVIKEFATAVRETREDPSKIPLWQTIISKYHPTFLGECQNAIEMADDMVKKSLSTIMFKDEENPVQLAERVVSFLNEHEDSKTHARHINIDDAKNCGLKIIDLEDDDELQDLVLTIHHCFMHTFSQSNAVKIVENHDGNAVVFMVQQTQ